MPSFSSKSMQVLLRLFLLTLYIHAVSSQNCSALNSFVEIISPNPLANTLTSSQALFKPYHYYIPPTELIKLDITDDICNEESISTDITKKMLLIFASNKNCSSHYKVYVAEQNGASSVLLVYNENNLINIIDDNTNIIGQGITTNIPLRAIGRDIGNDISSTLSSGETVVVTFGCFSSDYPSIICILDTIGDAWLLDGEYQRQSNQAVNGHPLYKKDSYSFMIPPFYIYLHDSNGDNDWKWSITTDPYNKNKIIARCIAGNVTDPSKCPLWETIQSGEFKPYTGLLVNHTLCLLSDSYLCLNSQQSNLAGMAGTYRLFNKQTSLWFREWDDCDTRPGVLTFGYGSFYLLDPVNGWIVATCDLDGNKYPSNTYNVTGYNPSLCTKWTTIVNGSLDEDNLISDKTFKIKMDVECDSYECESTISPDIICLEENSVMHGFIEGEYNKIEYIGPNYSTPVYEKSEQLYYDDESITIFLWYYGELSVAKKWWILSPNSLEDSIESYYNGDGIGVYGFCSSNVDNPVDCTADWNFYFGGNYHSDDSFTLDPGECTEAQAPENYTFPEYLCVGAYNTSSAIDIDYILGGYEINKSHTHLSDNIPHWVRPKNQNYEDEVYIYFDGFYGYWQIGKSLHVFEDVDYLCFAENGVYPTDCNEWYDNQIKIINNFYLYSGSNCTESDVLKLNHSHLVINSGEIMGIILVVLFLLCCCIFGAYFYKKNHTGQAQILKANAANNKDINNDDVNDDAVGLATNDKQNKLDFSPINPNTPTDDLTATADFGDIATKDDDNDDDVDDGDDDDDKTDNKTDDKNYESQIEDEDEKKDEDDKGIDSRRMSQQMLVAMKANVDEMRNALINDPVTAIRRYSQTNQDDDNDNQIRLNGINERFDPLFNSNNQKDDIKDKDIDTDVNNNNSNPFSGDNDNDIANKDIKTDANDANDALDDNIDNQNDKNVDNVDKDKDDDNNNDKPSDWTQF